MKTSYGYNDEDAGKVSSGPGGRAWEDRRKTPYRTGRALRRSEERLRLITDNMTDLVLMIDKNLIVQYASPSIEHITGFTVEDREGRSALELVHPDDVPILSKMSVDLFNLGPSQKVSYRLRHAYGHYIWLETTVSVLWDENKAFNGVVLNIRDITDRKQLEEELQQTVEEMEGRIKARTAELEEANTALRVLLKRRGEDQVHLEERLQGNIDELILPLIDMMRQGTLQDRERNCLNLLEGNLKEITSPFLQSLTSVYKTLTPQEVRIARMVRDGQNSKQMAELLGVSQVTVEKHRNNIRKKLGLVHGGTNLRSFLLSIP